jgi:hypothetical protein
VNTLCEQLRALGNAKKIFGHWAMPRKYSGIAWAFPGITYLALLQRVLAGPLRNLILGKA